MTFVSCANNVSENYTRRTKGPKIEVYLCHFFFLPRVLITCVSAILMAGAGLRSSLARPFHDVTPFIGPQLACPAIAFLTSPMGYFRHSLKFLIIC